MNIRFEKTLELSAVIGFAASWVFIAGWFFAKTYFFEWGISFISLKLSGDYFFYFGLEVAAKYWYILLFFIFSATSALMFFPSFRFSSLLALAALCLVSIIFFLSSSKLGEYYGHRVFAELVDRRLVDLDRVVVNKKVILQEFNTGNEGATGRKSWLRRSYIEDNLNEGCYRLIVASDKGLWLALYNRKMDKNNHVSVLFVNNEVIETIQILRFRDNC